LSTISDAFRKDRGVYFLVELDLHGLIKRYSTKTLNVPNSGGDALIFDGRLQAVPIFRSSFNFYSFRYGSPSVMIEIANDERFQDYEIGRKLEGGTGKLWVWSESLDWTDIEDKPIFAGAFRKESHNKDTYRFNLLDFSATNLDYLDSYDTSGERPGDMIYGILHRYTSLTSDQINNASLKTLNEVLSGLTIDTYVDMRTSCFDLIDRILTQVMCSRFQRYGKVCAIAFDLNGPVVDRLYQHDYLERTIEIGITPYEKIANNLSVNYGPTGSPLAWTSTLTVDRKNNRMCEKSFADYGAMPQIELNLADCSDTKSAMFCVNRYLDFFAFAHDVATIDLPYYRGFDLLEGDIAELNVEEGASLDGAGWVNEKALLIDKSYLADKIRTRWWKISVD